MDPAAHWDVTTIRDGTVGRISDLLARQILRTFRVNGGIAATQVCSPGDETNHCLGFLLTEGFLAQGETPLSILVDGDEVSAMLRHPGEPAPPRPVTSDLAIPIETVLQLSSVASGMARTHRSTGGTHSACVFRDGSPSGHAEDISRSASLEKAVGAALAGGGRLDRTLLCLTSRVPASFVHKSARAGIPMIAAVSAPTIQAAEEAARLGICLCGFVRGSGANVYSCPWRVGL